MPKEKNMLFVMAVLVCTPVPLIQMEKNLGLRPDMRTLKFDNSTKASVDEIIMALLLKLQLKLRYCTP